MATQNNVEPMAFSFTEMGTSMSDSYSCGIKLVMN